VRDALETAGHAEELARRERGAVSPAELAEAAGIDARYAREWLEGQAAAGLLEVEKGALPRFRLGRGHEETLLEASSLTYTAPLARALVAAVRPIDALLQTIRGGGGIPYADYGGQRRSSIEIARAYPKVAVDGIDSDLASSARTSTSPRAASTTAFASTPVTPPTVGSPGPTS
jgi:hypothetical protein